MPQKATLMPLERYTERKKAVFIFSNVCQHKDVWPLKPAATQTKHHWRR